MFELSGPTTKNYYRGHYVILKGNQISSPNIIVSVGNNKPKTDAEIRE